MEKTQWKVEGMTCANCALSINKTLEKKGLKNVSVNAVTGLVSFEAAEEAVVEDARQRVENLGYKVNGSNSSDAHAHHAEVHNHGLSGYMLRFWITLPFTLLLMLHMIPALHWHWLMNPWVQFGLALPVYIIGMEYFGKSAWRSIRGGVPNMDVLIALGATAAFAYSTYGLFTAEPANYLFFETAASIITIVFFGNYLEHISVARTQRAINKLTKKQTVSANMIAYDANGQENVFSVESTALRVGDLILVRTGEQVPADARLLTGDVEVNEALLTGESVPVLRKKNDTIIGGSVISNGNAKASVTATGDNTVMSSIAALMHKAQAAKPPVQKLADRISEWFIPAVLVIAFITLAGNVVAGFSFREALMRSVAVLVIACPCAMGLATPAAIAVGLGRAARHGILYTDVTRMELFRNIRQMVFDKTGTLTTGRFVISNFQHGLDSDEQFKKLVFSLEKFSNHPIAKSIVEAWSGTPAMPFRKVTEVKGLGMEAEAKEGNSYKLGSKLMLANPAADDSNHSLYLLKNNEVIGWIDMADEIRSEAKDVIEYCHTNNIKTILLSGDTLEKCLPVAEALGIQEVHAGKRPEEKLEMIAALNKSMPTAMVGDGINDAPALAQATVSVSLSEASQLAIQSASVVLTGNGLAQLPKAMRLGSLTYGTVRSNLFWAFLYNVVAIPVAALGYLHPSIGALIMGGSDVVLALNSLFLGVRKLPR